MQGGLAGRTCPEEAFGRPFDVLLAVDDEIDLPHGRPFAEPGVPSPDQPPLRSLALRSLLCAFTYKEKNKSFLFPSNT
jgi:hypothetical protein